MTPRSKNLVVAAIGDGSQHPTWLPTDKGRSFDVALIYYGDCPEKHERQGDYFVARKGSKFHLIADFLEQNPDAAEHYEYLWMPDDDIAATPCDVERLFSVVREYALLIAQPGIAIGDVTFRGLRQDPAMLLRYTGFVEVMCPVVSRDALRTILPTFRHNHSGWGIDWAWTRLVDRRRIAVVDAVGVHHTRPLGSGEAYRRFADLGIVPIEDLHAMLRKYGLNTWSHRVRNRRLKQGTARYRAIDLVGAPTSSGPPWWKRWSRTA